MFPQKAKCEQLELLVKNQQDEKKQIRDDFQKKLEKKTNEFEEIKENMKTQIEETEENFKDLHAKFEITTLRNDNVLLKQIKNEEEKGKQDVLKAKQKMKKRN